MTFGASGSQIARELMCAGVAVEQVSTLDSAVSLARTLARAGDAILLSPGCASFDAYDNFEHRGQCFAALAGGE